MLVSLPGRTLPPNRKAHPAISPRYKELGNPTRSIQTGRYGKNSVYADADFAGDPENRKSTTGFIILDPYGSPVAWKSKKQPIVAQSTADAEFTASAMGCQQAIWMRSVLMDVLGKEFDQPINLFNDNQPAIAKLREGRHKPSSRYLGVRYHWLKEEVNSGEITITYCPTNNMPADMLTKPLTPDKLHTFRAAVMEKL